MKPGTPSPSANRLWAALTEDDRIFALALFDSPNDANMWFTSLQAGRTVVELELVPGTEARIGDAVRIDDDWVGHIELPSPTPGSARISHVATLRGRRLGVVSGTPREQREEAQHRATVLRTPLTLVRTGEVFHPEAEHGDEPADTVPPSASSIALGLLLVVAALVGVGVLL